MTESSLLVENSAPICIAGMHRSGTSTVAQLFHRCGLYLGQKDALYGSQPANPDGFWENREYVAINSQILKMLGAGWDFPHPLAEGWHETEQLHPVRAQAERLLKEFEGHEPWGWKDPRNSLTLPFWTSLLPELKVVVCLRNPLEVALSLQKRNGSSYAFGLNLWTIYNQRLLEVLPPNQYIVTHYESYFYRPQIELRRLLDFLRLPASDQLVAYARSSTLKDLRHHSVTIHQLLDADVPEQLLELYLRMCRKADWDHDHPTVLDSTNGSEAALQERRPVV